MSLEFEFSGYAASFYLNINPFGSFGLKGVHGVARCYRSRELHGTKSPESGTMTQGRRQIPHTN